MTGFYGDSFLSSLKVKENVKRLKNTFPNLTNKISYLDFVLLGVKIENRKDFPGKPGFQATDATGRECLYFYVFTLAQPDEMVFRSTNAHVLYDDFKQSIKELPRAFVFDFPPPS